MSSFLVVMCFGASFASAYTYLDAKTIKKLDSDYNAYAGNKETYINSKIAQINTAMKNTTSTEKKRVYLELRTYYTNKKNDLLDVNDVVDELFGTKVTYTPKYNIPDIPEARSANITSNGYDSAKIEFRWTGSNNATYYQVRFDNGSWYNNSAHTNHFRNVACGKVVNAQVRACNASGCSSPLYLQETAYNCNTYNYNNNYNNNYYDNSYYNNNNYYNNNTYYNASQFKSNLYDMYQKNIITQAQYNQALRDLDSYSDYSRANSFYEGFLRSSYYNHGRVFLTDLKTKNVLTESEYSSKVTDMYNKIYNYNSSPASIYNDVVSNGRSLLRLKIVSAADQLINRGNASYSFKSEVLSKFDSVISTDTQALLIAYDEAMRRINTYNNYNYGTNDSCSVNINGITYRLESCTRSFSMRDGYGDQEFGFTVVSSDYNRSYYVEVAEVYGLPYNAVTWGFTSWYVTGSKYISKYFSDRYLDRGNYSGYVKLYITDSYGNKQELRQNIQINNY